MSESPDMRSTAGIVTPSSFPIHIYAVNPREAVRRYDIYHPISRERDSRTKGRTGPKETLMTVISVSDGSESFRGNLVPSLTLPDQKNLLLGNKP